MAIWPAILPGWMLRRVMSRAHSTSAMQRTVPSSGKRMAAVSFAPDPDRDGELGQIGLALNSGCEGPGCIAIILIAVFPALGSAG